MLQLISLARTLAIITQLYCFKLHVHYTTWGVDVMKLGKNKPRNILVTELHAYIN